MLFIFSGLVSQAVSGLGKNNKTSVKLGVAQVNITPSQPTLMSGYNSRKTPFTGIHDSLYAYSFYFENTTGKNLLITADLIGFSFDFSDETRSKISSAVGIPSENIMLVATHTHGGPSIDDRGEIFAYSGELQTKLIDVSLKATEKVVPFKMGIGKTYCNMNINRRAEFGSNEIWLGHNPSGPCDHELEVMKFESMDNQLLAVLINWPCHGTVTGYTNFQVTGDWPGAATRFIRESLGKDAIVAVTAGASGDINPVYGKDDGFRRVDAVGYHVCKEAMKVLPEIKTRPVSSVQSVETNHYFPGKKACEDHFPRHSFEPGPDKKIRFTVLRIGNIALAGVSGELMTEIGMEIKKQSPIRTVVVTHCNGSSGYICTDKSYPEAGYEIQVTEFMPGVEKPLVNEMIRLINSVK